MRIRRTLATVVGAVAVATSLALAGCSSGSDGGADADAPTVSVQLKTLSSPYWLQVKAGAEAGGDETGADVTLAGATAETAVQEQVNKIRAAITQDVDAIVVAATSPEEIKPVLSEAVAADIKVLLLDTSIDGFDDALTFIGTDNLGAGEKAGEFISEQVSTGEMAILEGQPGNSATTQRAEGVKEVLGATDIEIVAEVSAHSDRAEARTAMADMLQANPNITIVFAANDDMALGAVEALKAADVDLSKFTIVGVDGTADAADSIIAGELTATTAQNSYDMGKVGVEEAVKAINGETIETRIDTGTTLVEASNAEEYLTELNNR